MPDNNGKLEPRDYETISSWWTNRWKNPVVCPVCKTSEWVVSEYVVNIPRHAHNAFEGDTPTYPHIMVGCKCCAHNMLFNAVAIGVSQPADPAKVALFELPSLSKLGLE